MTLATNSAKWIQTMQVAWTNQLAYKLNFLILIIGPVFVFFFIKYNLWSSIYAMEGISRIEGYDLRTMLEYQVWVMIVSLLSQSYNNMKLAEDIRLGRISSYLIYPFGFWQFHSASFLGTQCIQIIVTILTIAVVTIAGFSLHISWPDTFVAISYCSLVGLLWFSISFFLGLAAFWLEETWILRVIFIVVAQFLSGAIIPLEIYPPFFQSILSYTPFPYMTYIPVKIFMGQYTGNTAAAFSIITFWLLFMTIVTTVTWKKGLRMYTGAGM